MKVLFISRATLYDVPGGDTVQVKSTAKYLQKLGVSVDIKLAHERIDYDPYDLIHYFNIFRPADILVHVRKSKKPFVVSTIFVDYTEFEHRNRRGYLGLIAKFLPGDFIEYAKAFIRFIKNNERINSWEFLFLGQKRSIRRIINEANLLLPNSKNEYKRLEEKYNIESKYRVIPNAVDLDVFSEPESQTSRKSIVICVARIEGRKNQLNLIRALKNSGIPLYLIGDTAPNHQQYFQLCKMEADKDMHFLGALPQEQIKDYYLRAKVHVLPSWFETTGLSSLEAAALGCNIVITNKGDTEEYFKGLAYYCDPNDVRSIRMAIESALQAPAPLDLRKMVLNNYTWDRAAQLTLSSYMEVVD